MSSSSAAARVFRRLLSTHRSGPRAAASIPPKSELQAIKVDNGGRAWRIGVQVGRGEGLLGDLHPRDAPLLERTGSFGDTPATLTTRPGMLIVRFQPFSAVIGDSCALLMDANRASPKAAAGAIVSALSQHSDEADFGAHATNHHPHHGGDKGAPFHADTLAAVSEEDDTRAHAVIGSDIAIDDFPLRALECILDEATAGGYYHQKLRRIKLLTDYCLETITEELKGPGWGPGAGEAGFQRLLPLRQGGLALSCLPSHPIPFTLMCAQSRLDYTRGSIDSLD